MTKDVEMAVEKAINTVGLDVVKQMSMFLRRRNVRQDRDELCLAA